MAFVCLQLHPTGKREKCDGFLRFIKFLLSVVVKLPCREIHDSYEKLIFGKSSQLTAKASKLEVPKLIVSPT